MPKHGETTVLAEPKIKSTKAVRNFPKFSLERALAVAAAIKGKNAGNPMDSSAVAKAVKISYRSTNYPYIITSSSDYGLTSGTAYGKNIALTELGKFCVYPKSPTAELSSKRAAFLTVPVFGAVLKYYKGSKLPEMEYLSNTLTTEFKIDTANQAEFVQLFTANCQYLKIGEDFIGEDGNPKDEVASESTKEEGGTAPGTVTLTAPKKGKGTLLFVIMPFVERTTDHKAGFFKEVLESLIVPAGKELGFVVRTANRDGSDVIQSTIINDLLQADLVLADLTEHNPNVLFELGMRMAEDKPVALIRAKGTGKIFDVDNMLRVYDYNSSLWPSTLQHDVPNLTSHIKAAWDNKDTDISYMKLLRQNPAKVKTS